MEILLLGHHITKNILQHRDVFESLAELISANVITDEGSGWVLKVPLNFQQIIGVEEYFLYNVNLALILPTIPIVKLQRE